MGGKIILNKGLKRIIIFFKRKQNMMLSRFTRWKILNFKNTRSGINNLREDSPQIIVTLTTIPSRTEFVSIAIETILRQTVKPNKIILWLDEEKFLKVKLPDKLQMQTKRGLEIRYIKDIGVHTKYYYAVKEYPNSIIITVDDDIYYEKNLIKNLMKSYYKYPKAVSCYRAHEMTIDEEGAIKPYTEWNWNALGFRGPSHRLLQTGVGGVLYPPNSFYKDVLNKDIFSELSPQNDDIWLKIMLLLNDIKVVKVSSFSVDPITIDGSQIESLNSTNVHGQRNDIQLRNIVEHYNIRFSNYFS